MKLYNHQQKIVDLFPAKHLMAHATGTGKTITAIELSKKDPNPTLIIVPKSIVEKWKRDLITFGVEGEAKIKEICDREVHILCEKQDKLWTIISKEKFRSNASKMKARSSIIVDEAHYFAGTTSDMSKSLLKYIRTHNIPFVWLCTATPYLSTPWNVYQLARYLGIDFNYHTFKNKFFYEVPMGGKSIPVIKKGAEKNVAEIVNRLGSTVKMEECIDVPDQVFETEYFSLTTEQKTVIKMIKLQEFNPAVRFMKIHQIENGTLKEKSAMFANNKLERIVDICKENKKVAIFCRYNLQINQIKDRLKKEKIKSQLIRGDVPVAERDKHIKWAEESDEAVLIINASCAEGYELPSIGVIIYASLSFSYKDYIQSQGRFLRINKPKKNVFIHLLVSGVDEDVYKAIKRKEDFNIEIYAKQYEQFSNNNI